ncbi:hypothetical protein [Natrinema caseinilyticum]|uniref:hypothetical protein n=1 Tax=Natrinema caseinilyticum TaxID=2961570 RepID=UPI0020C45B6B|nr:hypothetical protein [Natrinema caseinilyticum]
MGDEDGTESVGESRRNVLRSLGTLPVAGLALSSSDVVSEASAADNTWLFSEYGETKRDVWDYSDEVYFHDDFVPDAEESLRALTNIVEVEVIDFQQEKESQGYYQIAVRMYVAMSVQSTTQYGYREYSKYHKKIPAIRDLELSLFKDEITGGNFDVRTASERPEWGGVWHNGIDADVRDFNKTAAGLLLDYGADVLESSLLSTMSLVKDTAELLAKLNELADTDTETEFEKYYHKPKSEINAFKKFEIDLYPGESAEFTIESDVNTVMAKPVDDHDSIYSVPVPGYSRSFRIEVPDGSVPDISPDDLGEKLHLEDRMIDDVSESIDSHPVSDPVSFFGPLSYDGPQPSHVRVRDGSVPEVQIEEWEYQNGVHRAESVNGLLIEPGHHELTDGSLMIAGRLDGVDEAFHTIPFGHEFNSYPVVLTQPQTYNGSQAIVSRQRNLGSDSVDVCVQEEEGNNGVHRGETIGFVATEMTIGGPKTYEYNGVQREFEAGRREVDDQWTTIHFSETYDNPHFLADIQTYEGANTAGLRYRNLTSSSVEVFVEEEQSADDEVSHVGELVGYMVFEPN